MTATEPVHDADQRKCGCCGRQRPARRVAELGMTPGVFICAGCALWAARRSGPLATLSTGLLSLVRRRRHRHIGAVVRASIPILPSSDLGRSAEFYAAVGFDQAEPYDTYLVLHSGDVELHFAEHEQVIPGTCFVHVSDATQLWTQVRELGVDGVGPIADQDYGLREFVVTDPDGNRVRFGSPAPG